MAERAPTPSERRDRLVFYPVAVVGGVFCMTIFVSIAVMFGDNRAPVNQWINTHINSILVYEAAILIAISLAAMTIDRLRTLAAQRRSAEAALFDDSRDAAPAGESPRVD